VTDYTGIITHSTMKQITVISMTNTSARNAHTRHMFDIWL